MSLIAVPLSPAQTRWWAYRVAAPLLAIVLLSLGWWVWRDLAAPSPVAAGQFYSVVPMDLDVKVSSKAELAAVNNNDILCEVEGQATITTIIPEGSNVKKGDILCTLDASAIKQKIEDTTLDLQKAEADLTTAKEMKEIQESQNAANLDAADVALTLAQLDMQAYTDGTYPQDLQNAQTTLDMAQITLKDKDEDLQQTRNLFGKGFVTASDVKKAELDVTTATNDVAKGETAMRVLKDFSHPRDMAAKKNALSQADRAVRTKRENAANLGQKVADMQAKTQSLEVIKRRMDHLQEQLADCTIIAPADGMVVYASSGDRWAQTQIQEGAQVHERQPILRLPDISSMKAVARIDEAEVNKLHEGLRAKVTTSTMNRPIGASITKISVLADSGQRFFNPDSKIYPVDLVLDETPRNLKPGLDANVEILVNHLNNVIAVPLGAIYSAGNDAYVFIKENDAIRPLKVKIGQSNDTHVQIKDGLDAGTEVMLLQPGQGRDLLQKNGIQVQSPTTRSSDDSFAAPRHVSHRAVSSIGLQPRANPTSRPSA